MDNASFDGLWVGQIGKDFVRIHFVEGWGDLPQQRLFHLPVNIQANPLTIRVGEKIYLAGGKRGNSFTGQTTGGCSAWLQATCPLSTNPTQEIAGVYGEEDAISVFAAWDFRLETWTCSYQRGDQVVRLYPLSLSDFLSETGEHFHFTEGHLQIKTGDVVQRLKRKQIADEHEIEVRPAAGHVIRGTLLMPKGKEAPHPVIMIVHGASQCYRDDLRGWAHLFLEQGLAVFLYDKRGWGASTGERLWSEVNLLAEDAQAVLSKLRTHPLVGPVGLLGFSNGGWVAPLAASQGDEAAFLVILSGCGVTPARQEQIRRINVAREVLGATPDQLTLLESFWEQAFRYLATGDWTEAFDQIFARLDQNPGIRALPRHAGMPDELQPVPPTFDRLEWKTFGGGSPEMLFDPVPILASLTIPILCIWGEQDSVIPVAESVQAFESALHGHRDYKAFIVAEAGHELVLIPPEGEAGPGDEDQRLQTTVRTYAPGVWGTILNWVQEQIG